MKLILLLLLIPSMAFAMNDIEEPGVVAEQKKALSSKNDPAPQADKPDPDPEPEPQIHVLRLTGMAPGPKVSIVLNLDGVEEILHLGDTWHQVTILAVDQKAQTVSVSHNGISHTLKLRGYSILEFSDDR